MVAAWFVFIGLTVGAKAADPPSATPPEVAGRVIAARGEITVTRPHASPVALQKAAIVHHGDAIKTGHDASARILLQDDSVLDLGADTSLRLDNFSFKAKERSRMARITLWVGRLWARVSPNLGDDQNFHISTPNAVAGVRGTSLVVDVQNGGKTQVTVVNGSVQVRDLKGVMNVLGALQQSTVNRSGQTLNLHVTPETVTTMGQALNISSTLGGDTADRLQAVASALPPPAVPPAAPTPPPEPPLATVNAAQQGTVPPLQFDPSRNFARVRVQARLVRGTP